MAEMSEVEALLRSALVPVEPSEALCDRLSRPLGDHRPGRGRAGRLGAFDHARPAQLGPDRGRGGGRERGRDRPGGAQRPPSAPPQQGRRPAAALEHGLREVSSDLRSRLGR